MQSAYANDFIQEAVAQGRVGQATSSTRAALLKLQDIFERQKGDPSATHNQCFSSQRPLPAGGLNRLPLPPVSVVLDLLHKVTSL